MELTVAQYYSDMDKVRKLEKELKSDFA